MAEAFFRAAVNERGLDFTTSSAGTLEGDRPIAPMALSAVRRVDPGMATHRSRPLRADDIADADLVLGMARAHVREVVVLVPEAWDRTFTLKELARRGSLAGPRRLDQTLIDWLVMVGAGRSRSDLLGDSDIDDISDPVGDPASLGRSVAREIKAMVGTLVELVLPG